MGNIFGRVFRITTWGESHGASLGDVIDGCPPGIEISSELIQNELDRRRPGQSSLSSPRQEKDRVSIRSGLVNNFTTGMPITLEIFNEDVDSATYEHLRDLWRPGHADYTYDAKYGIRDHRGSGRASGRETVARVAAGAIAKIILARFDIELYAFTRSIGNVCAQKVIRDEIEHNAIRCPDPEVLSDMTALIERVKADQDSIGGIVELRINGLPAGLGDPVFDKFDAVMAYAIMGLGAVKGVEIGDGFKVAQKRGSENNDEFMMVNDEVVTKTNHCGGVLGGITNGQEFVLRAAVKPPASIGRQQETVTARGDAITINVQGRHDPTIVPRIVPVVESMAAIVTVDFLLFQQMILAFKSGS